MVVAPAMITPPVALVFKLKGWSLQLDLIGSPAATHEGVITVPFTRHMEYRTREIVGDAVMPAQIREHTLPRSIVVDAEVMKSIFELASGFHSGASE